MADWASLFAGELGREKERIVEKVRELDIVEENPHLHEIFCEAGTGKTTALVFLVADLIDSQGVPPDEIVLLMFNQRSAEMRFELFKALRELGHESAATAVTIKNYHGFSQRILDEYGHKLSGRSHWSSIHDVVSQTQMTNQLQAIASENDLTIEIPDEIAVRQVDTPAEELQSLISATKPALCLAGEPAAELDAQLPSKSCLNELVDFCGDIQTHAGFAPDCTVSPAAVEATIDAHAHVADRADALATTLPETSIGNAIQSCLQSQIAATCRNQREMLERHRASIPAEMPDLLTVSRQLLRATPSQTPSGADAERSSTPTAALAANGVHRYPTAELRHLLQAIWVAHELLPGWHAYETWLGGDVDHPGQLGRAAHLMRDETVATDIADDYSYILCDEFQDTSITDYVLIQSLASNAVTVTAGDDHQAINRFRGSAPEVIDQKVANDYQRTRSKISKTHRCRRQPPLTLANRLLNECECFSTAANLQARDMETGETPESLASTPPLVIIPVAELDGVADVEDAIVQRVSALADGPLQKTADEQPLRLGIHTRSRWKARSILERLTAEGITCRGIGQVSRIPEGIEAVFAYLRVLVDQTNTQALRHLLTNVYGIESSRIDALQLAADDTSSLRTALTTANVTDQPKMREAQADLSTLCGSDYASVNAALTALRTTVLPDLATAAERDLLPQLRSRAQNDRYNEFTSSAVELFIGEVRDHLSQSPSIDDDDTLIALVGTTHGAKGKTFDRSIVVELESTKSHLRRTTHANLRHALAPTEQSLGEIDLLTRTEREQRCLANVGLTRHRNQLLLVGDAAAGGHSPPKPADSVQVGDVDLLTWLPDVVDWTRPQTLDLWGEATNHAQGLAEWVTTQQELRGEDES